MTAHEVEAGAGERHPGDPDAAGDREVAGRGIGGRAVAALGGVLAAALALGVADAVAGVLAPAASPVSAVGQAFIDLTPGWLKDTAIAAFGTRDKLALLSGMALAITVLAAVAGLLAARRPAAGAALVGLLGAAGAAAALTRPGAGPLALVPSLVGVLVALPVLVRLTRPVPDHPSGAPRRAVLMAGSLAVAVGSGAVGRRLAAGPAGADPGTVTLPAPADPAPALPAGTEAGVPGATGFQTPNRAFYRIDTALAAPAVDAGAWRLRVHGLVDTEVELSFDDLLRLPLVERWITLTCVSNEVGGTLAGNARWLGYPVRDLLRRCGVASSADMVLSRSTDGFTASTPLSALTDPGRDALIAVGMNGTPLPREHGFPARLVVPGLYGYVSATKWLTDLEITRFDRAQAYWTVRGYSAQAPIRTASRIDVPRPFARPAAGPVAVAGVAWAQHRGITRVEVRVDGSGWQPARLAAAPGPDTWREWVWTWDATPGTHTLEVRATDSDGIVQPQQRRTPRPDGATGWHSVVVQVG